MPIFGKSYEEEFRLEQEKVANLTRDVQIREQTLRSTNAELEKYKNAYNNNKKAYNDNTEAYNRLVSLSDAKDEEIKSLRTQVSTLTDSLANANGSIAGFEEENRDLLGDRQELGAQKNDLLHKVKSKTEELKEKTKLLGDASARVDQLETSSKVLTDEKAKLVEQLEEAKRTITDLNAQILKQNDTIYTLTTKAAEYSTKFTETVLKLEKLKQPSSPQTPPQANRLKRSMSEDLGGSLAKKPVVETQRQAPVSQAF